MRIVVFIRSFDAVSASLNGSPILNLFPKPLEHKFGVLDVTPFHAAEGVPNSAYKLDYRLVV